MANWRTLISLCMEEEGHGETMADIISCTLDEKGLDRNFSASYGSTEGRPFTAWTTRRVYFPVCYDGSEWVASVPRDPCDAPSDHVGGG